MEAAIVKESHENFKFGARVPKGVKAINAWSNKTEIDKLKNDYAGTVPGDYYDYLSKYLNGQNPSEDDIFNFNGDDCLTGLGIPKLPAPENVEDPV